MLIKVEKTPELAAVVPGQVWAVQPFQFNAQSFSPKANTLNAKRFTAKLQEQCLNAFITHPNKPLTYICASQPDYQQAMYFAAYLASIHIKKIKSSNVHWEQINNYIASDLSTESYAKPSMIVLSVCYEDTTSYRVEKIRDIIEAFPNIPKVIVASGIDPISLAAYKLHIPVNAVYYTEDPIMKATY